MKLKQREIHRYKEADVGSIAVTTQAGTKKAKKGEKQVDKGTKTTWSYLDTPGKEDQTLSNFLGRFKRIRPANYSSALKPEDLTQAGRVQYFDPSGKELGFVDLYFGKDVKDPDGTVVPGTRYFARTEETRAFGSVDRMAAEKVHQDMAEFFGAPAVPPPDAPATKPKPEQQTPPPPSHGGHGHGH